MFPATWGNYHNTVSTILLPPRFPNIFVDATVLKPNKNELQAVGAEASHTVRAVMKKKKIE